MPSREAGVDRDLELGADTVGRGDENRVLETGGPEVEQSAEAAGGRRPRRAVGSPWQRGNAVDERVAGIDVDTGILVVRLLRPGSLLKR
jgi:hypothetical protein